MRIARHIAASRARVFSAFLNAEALRAWLPPPGMRAELRDFDPREGGGYRMTLTYDRATPGPKGKTTEDSDAVTVRFLELVPDTRLVQAARFTSDDPAFAGTMRMTWTFADAPGGTEVAVTVEDAPPGIRPEDHALGIRQSLENLAAFVEGP